MKTALRQVSHPRRGIITIVLLAAFAIVVGFCGAWTKAILRNRQERRLAEEQLQVGWLADAGVRRAAALLKADPNFRNETWRLAEGDFALPGAAKVVIRVERLGGSGAVNLSARASYPGDAPRVRQTKTVYFNPVME
jgi:hypothetical protein